MTDLIRNCAHHSTHQTLIDLGQGAQSARTIKTTFTADGVAGLQAEHDGLSWYASRLNKNASEMVLVFRSTPGYARLETPYVNGNVVHMPADPDTLIGKLNNAVSHYISKIWNGDETPSHGDYSLSNHVFNNADDVIRIIDWEHFNRKLPAQYDPLYMIVEPFLFWDVNQKKPSERSLAAANTAILNLNEAIKLEADAIASPASWLRKTADTHRDAWGQQADKVPFLNAHKNQISTIDRVLGKI